MVGCFGFSGLLRQYFSLYRAVSQREGEREERIEERKNVQTTPTRTYCKRNGPLPYYHPNCRTPRHWKLPRTIAPPDHPSEKEPQQICSVYRQNRNTRCLIFTSNVLLQLETFNKQTTVYSGGTMPH